MSNKENEESVVDPNRDKLTIKLTYKGKNYGLTYDVTPFEVPYYSGGDIYYSGRDILDNIRHCADMFCEQIKLITKQK